MWALGRRVSSFFIFLDLKRATALITSIGYRTCCTLYGVRGLPLKSQVPQRTAVQATAIHDTRQDSLLQSREGPFPHPQLSSNRSSSLRGRAPGGSTTVTVTWFVRVCPVLCVSWVEIGLRFWYKYISYSSSKFETSMRSFQSVSVAAACGPLRRAGGRGSQVCCIRVAAAVTVGASEAVASPPHASP